MFIIVAVRVFVQFKSGGGGIGKEGEVWKRGRKEALQEEKKHCMKFLWSESTAGGSGGRSRLLLLFLLVPLSTMVVVVMLVVLLLLLKGVMMVMIASVVMVIWHRRQMASSVLLVVHACGFSMVVLTIDRPHVFIVVSASRRGIAPSIRDNAKRRPRRVRMWLLLLVMMTVLLRNMMTAVAAILLIQLHHLRARRVRRQP